MTSRARAAARALREVESAKRRKEAERRARRRALISTPGRLLKRLVPRRGHTGRLRTRRDRAQLAAVAIGLLVLLVAVFVTIQSWTLRIGAVVLALLVAPVLVILSQPNRRVH